MISVFNFYSGKLLVLRIHFKPILFSDQRNVDFEAIRI